jgi:hypothetical protein
LIYYLNPEGNSRKVSLDEQLKKLGLPLPATAPALPPLIDNNKLPSIAFIIGLWLGDGTLGVTLDDPKARYPILPLLLLLLLLLLVLPKLPLFKKECPVSQNCSLYLLRLLEMCSHAKRLVFDSRF